MAQMAALPAAVRPPAPPPSAGAGSDGGGAAAGEGLPQETEWNPEDGGWNPYKYRVISYTPED